MTVHKESGAVATLVAIDGAKAWNPVLMEERGDLHALRQQHFRLSELGDDLLRTVLLPRPCALRAILRTLA